MYNTLRSIIMSLVRERLELHRQTGKTVRMHVTGHSLGGAVACLFALDIASARRVDPSRPGDHLSLTDRKPVVYTYGSPRPGNAAFRSIYNMMVPDTYRIVAGRDLVPTLSPAVYYRQIGREVWLDNTGAATFVMSRGMRDVLPQRDD